jgi:hypothetical protein
MAAEWTAGFGLWLAVGTLHGSTGGFSPMTFCLSP